MVVILSMFLLLVIGLAIIGGGIYWWANREAVDFSSLMLKLTSSDAAAREKAAVVYQKRKSILGTNEMLCMAALLKVAGDKARVIPKLRLTDLLSAGRGADNDEILLRQLALHNVDFVLVHRRTLAPLLAINLERKPKRDEMGDVVPGHKPRTDAFSEDALRVAGVPLLKLIVKDEYDPVDLSRRIKLVMAGNTAEQDAELDIVSQQTAGRSIAGNPIRHLAARLKGGMPGLRLKRS